MRELLPTIVYLLCFVTSSACALLLAVGYRRSGARLLMWSALCFLLLALNNLLVIADLLLFPHIDFRLWRHLSSFAAIAVLLFGFIWNLDEERE